MKRGLWMRGQRRVFRGLKSWQETTVMDTFSALLLVMEAVVAGPQPSAGNRAQNHVALALHHALEHIRPCRAADEGADRDMQLTQQTMGIMLTFLSCRLAMHAHA